MEWGHFFPVPTIQAVANGPADLGRVVRDANDKRGISERAVYHRKLAAVVAQRKLLADLFRTRTRSVSWINFMTELRYSVKSNNLFTSKQKLFNPESCIDMSVIESD